MKLFSFVLILLAGNPALAASPQYGYFQPLDPVNEKILQQDCKTLIGIGGTRELALKLEQQTNRLAEISAQVPAKIDLINRAQRDIDDTQTRMLLLGGPLLQGAKWTAVYHWEFPATTLIADGMAWPYQMLNSKARLFGTEVSLDPTQFKVASLHRGGELFIGIDLTVQASSYELCTMKVAVSVSGTLDYNNAARPALADLILKAGSKK